MYHERNRKQEVKEEPESEMDWEETEGGVSDRAEVG